MDKLAEFLIEKETITGKEFMEIFRKEKGLPEPEEKDEASEEAGSKAIPEAEHVQTAEDHTESESAPEVQGGMTEPENTPESEGNAEQKPEAGSDVESNEPEQDRTETDSRPVGRFSNGRID